MLDPLTGLMGALVGYLWGNSRAGALVAMAGAIAFLIFLGMGHARAFQDSPGMGLRQAIAGSVAVLIWAVITRLITNLVVRLKNRQP